MQPGDRVADRFVIVRRAGSGGMGDVYQARDESAGEVVALKVLKVGREEHGRRFAREASVLAELRHPNIVRYVAHGELGSGEPWLAMEWLEGETLAHRLGRAGLSLDDATLVGQRVADALRALHERGVVHRDLKPGNIVVVGGDLARCKVVDFGIARYVGADRDLTRPGMLMGTPGFMAPEQARGDGEIDARADVFALGCVLYRCITGRPAFAGSDPLAILLKVMLEDTPRPSRWVADVPPALDALVVRMLAKSPDDRPRDAGIVAAQLATLPDVSAMPTRRMSSLPPALGTAERRVMCLVLARFADGPPLVPSPGSRPPPPAAPASEPPSPAEPGSASRSGDAASRSGESASASRASSRPTPASTTSTGFETPTIPVILGARLRSLRSAAERHQGVLDILADGSVVVVLGSAGAATDLAARAARCALAIRDELPGTPMILATGQGVLEASAPVGDVIDRAVRMLDARAGKASGAIRLDDATAGLLDERFDVRGDAKGLYLRGERVQGTNTRTVLGKPTPTVGRDREIAALEGIWDECVSEPVARAVLLTAPAGVGKSRVRFELLQRLKKRGTRATLWMARGDPMAAGSPLGMLAVALRRAMGLFDGEAAEVRRQKLEARLGLHFAGDDLSRVSEFLGEIIGVPYPEDHSVQLKAARQDALLMGDQMRRAWEDFVAAEAERTPLLVVLEDLHWGDVPTVRFLDAALRRLRDRPLMILAIGRPEVRELFPKLWEERGLLEMRLLELTKRASDKLVRQVLGPSAADAVVDQIVERAAGNAFYLEELIRAVSRGRGSELPDSVLAMVQARLESLDPAARRAMRAASVFGEVFWEEGVLELVGGESSRHELSAQLATLVEQEVVVRRGTSRFRETGEYVFRHGLVREVAYSMLTDADRTLGHQLAGAWLEVVGESDALVLAEHYERGGEPQRAVNWYRRAAEMALEGDDLDAAFARAERGIACGATGEVRGVLRIIQAEVCLWRGEQDRTDALGNEAVELLPKSSPLWFRLVGGGVLLSAQLGRFDRLALMVGVLREAEPHEEGAGAQGLCWGILVWLLMLVGQRELAKEFLGRLEGLARRVGNDDPVASGWIGMGRFYWTKFVGDDLWRTLEVVRESEASFERTGDFRTTGLARLHRAWALTELGAYGEAEALLRRVLEAGERRGLGTHTSHAKRFLAPALAFGGKLAEGKRVALEACHELATNRMSGGIAKKELARILLLEGDVEGAVDQARAAVDGLLVFQYHRGHALAILADALLASGKPAEAAEAALASLDTGNIADGEALARVVLAEALAKTGDEQGAREVLQTGVDRVRARARQIADDALRRSFLERVPENARTLRVAGDWGIADRAALVTENRSDPAPVALK